jgi:uncharacterized membrane protein YgdD (TMEM256/DUF423 family)
MPAIARRWIVIGSFFGALGVALGAFGAHGLGGFLDSRGYAGDDLARRLEIYDTAIQYQMLHAVALVLTGLALERRTSGWWRFAGWSFLLGMLLFSGLLKALAILGPQWSWLGAIVPIGGLAMIVGWLALAVGAATEPQPPASNAEKSSSSSRRRPGAGGK